MAATRLMTANVTEGTGYAISANNGQKIVTDLATMLHTPMVVVAKTEGNKSRCDT